MRFYVSSKKLHINLGTKILHILRTYIKRDLKHSFKYVNSMKIIDDAKTTDWTTDRRRDDNDIFIYYTPQLVNLRRLGMRVELFMMITI